jgi:hypothetical protein
MIDGTTSGAMSRFQYHVAISYSEDAVEHAASLYRRLVDEAKVFFDRVAQPPLLDPPGFDKIYESSAVVAIVAGSAYAGSPWAEMECTNATLRLKASQSDSVQLIKLHGAKLPAQVQSVESMLSVTHDVVTLPETGWYGKIDWAAARIREKLKRLSGTTSDIPPLGSQRHGDTHTVDGCPSFLSRRQLRCLAPLFDGTPGPTNIPPEHLIEYARSGARGCASLHGQIEQIQRAAELVRRLRDLAYCSLHTGERPDQLGQHAQTAARHLLDVLRSSSERLAAVDGHEQWLAPDYAQLITRLNHYLLRHLQTTDGAHPEHAGLVTALDHFLFPSAKPGKRALLQLIQTLSADAGDVATHLHNHFMTTAGRSPLSTDRTSMSPKAMLFQSAEDAITRRPVGISDG